MTTPVFELKPEPLAQSYGEVAFKVYRGDILAITGVSGDCFGDFDRRILRHVTYNYEVVTDYEARDDRIALIDETVSVGHELHPGWEQRVTRDFAHSRQLRRLIDQLDVVVDRRAAMTLLTEKKIQLAVAAVNTTDCLLLDDPPLGLTQSDRDEYWHAVWTVTRACDLAWMIRTSDLDMIAGWLNRLLIIKAERVVINAPMRRIRRYITHPVSIQIKPRQRVTAWPRLLLALPRSVATQVFQVPNDSVRPQRPLKRRLNGKQGSPATVTLSQFVAQSQQKSALMLYWLNQRLNL